MKLSFYKRTTGLLIATLLINHFSLSAQWISNDVNITMGNIRKFLIDTVNSKLYLGGNYMKVSNNVFGGFGYYEATSFKLLNNIVVDADIFSSTFYKNKIIVGGFFLSINEDSCIKCVAQWDSNEWKPLGAGLNSTVWNLKVIDDTLFAMGSYFLSGTSYLSGIAKWDGNNWINVYNFPQYDENIVNDICKYKNELYVGGNFHSYDTNNIRDIAKWNGQYWESVGGGIQGDMGINRMVVYHDKLVVAGLFYKQNGNAGNFIMTWDGQQWGELGGGTCGQLNNPNSLGTIYDMQVYNDKLYICGLFNYAGTTPASHVAVWDGERWCGYPGVFDNSVYAMTIFKDTIYIACGMTIDGDTVNNFARWGRGLLPDTCGSVGISYIDYDKENVLVYPNPCNNYIWIESADQNFSDGFIEIVDFIGKTYGIKKEIIDGKVRINTLSLAKGIYLLKITSGNSIYSCKFIKE